MLFCWKSSRVWLKYAVHVWDQPCQTTTSTASTPEGSSKDSTALISIQGLWICDIHFLRELETRVWLKYAVHVWDRLYQTTTSTASTPEGSSKNTTALISIQGLWICDIHFPRELEKHMEGLL